MSVDLFAAFATDTPKEQEGVLTVVPGCGDTLFRIAREGNKAWGKLVQKRFKQHKLVLESKGDAAEAMNEKIMIEVVSETVLLGWEGKITYQGKQHEYSKEVARSLLSHKEFMIAIMRVANSMETYKVVKDDEDVKN